MVQRTPNLENLRLCILASNSEGGKSSLLKYFIQENINKKVRNYKKIILVCPTYYLQETYQFIPEVWVYDHDLDINEFVEKLFEIQKSKAINNKIPESEKILLVLDDVLGSVQGNCKALMMIASKARHHLIDTIILSQTIGFLSSRTLRSNSTYMLLGKMSDDNLEIVIKKLQSYMSREEALYFVNKVWSDPYRFIVINNSTKDTGPPIYTYKLDIKKLRPNYRIVLKEKDIEQDKIENELLRETEPEQKILEAMQS